ncbi:NAD-dependent epimerase/dehydratase family protein [Nostocoides veronense]|uniref:SDR family oxidoreductase n=1 Tax=Nostocoides veronense TaxID=330836 RepID=A0ABN2LQV7_9MICO
MVDPGAALSILFYGGSGVISAACVREAAAAGHRVSVLNRGQTRSRMVPEGIELLQADVRDSGAVAHALGERRFDVVADFLAFHPDNVAQSLEQVRGRVGHYVFISSASAYQTPPARLPVTESTPLRNPMWEYSRNKIACEDLLVRRYRDEGLPMTIVRPSHTYDETSPPLFGGWTTVERLLRGAPVVVPGDGTSLWTVTQARDVARGFVPLLGNPAAYGEAVHLTRDDALPLNAIVTTLADVAGVGADLVHVASDTLCAARPDLTGPLLGDMANSMLFDNTKARSFAPGWHARTTLAQGAREIIRWRREHTPEVDHDLDAYFDQLVARVR